MVALTEYRGKTSIVLWLLIILGWIVIGLIVAVIFGTVVREMDR